MCGQWCGSAHLPLCVCTVGPAGYNIRQQAQRSTNALKTKNQDTNGETICWEQTFSRSIKKSFIVRSLCLLFSCMRKVLQKLLMLNAASLGSVQRHWTLHFHSNWGMFTVAKREVVFHDTRYYLWRKPCVCAVSLCPAVATSPSWNCKLQSVWGLLLETPLCLLSFLPRVEIQVDRLIQNSCGTGRPTSFPPSLLEFDLFWQSSFIQFRVLCLFFFFLAIDSPIALNCAG